MNLSMGLGVQFRGTTLASMCETLGPISNAKMNDNSKPQKRNPKTKSRSCDVISMCMKAEQPHTIGQYHLLSGTISLCRRFSF